MSQSYTRDQKLKILERSLDFESPPPLKSLTRTIYHQFAMKTEADWGAENAHQAQMVQGLFVLLRLQCSIHSVTP